MMPTEALIASHTISRVPTQTDSLSDREMRHLIANGFDFANHFMTGNQWKLRHSPSIL
ncbi:hypothetical protein NSMM_380076 [Nitrosomonas mobilis]|uniref:Uncharacterized protein n=1 Tax=Nitrosomonas mobilis TaxID=51642 RepID=A0A1G5SE32_9PROT|nr:hypothetical protein NSMM_380076 [Nitrosomonas mobilis]